MRDNRVRVSTSEILIDPTREILCMILCGMLKPQGPQVKKALLQQFLILDNAVEVVAKYLSKQGFK